MDAILRMANRGRKSTRAEDGSSPRNKKKWPSLWMTGENGSPIARIQDNWKWGSEREPRGVVTSDHSEHKSCHFCKGDGRGRALLTRSRAHPHCGHTQGVLSKLFTSSVLSAPQPQALPGSLCSTCVLNISVFSLPLHFLCPILTLITTNLFPGFCFHSFQFSLNFLSFPLKQILLFICYLKLTFTLVFILAFK